jgi:hypothetical protein
MKPKPVHRVRDPLDRLRLGHKPIRKLFRDHQLLRQVCVVDPKGWADIVERLCDALSQCALIEEDILYPVVRSLLCGTVLGQTNLCEHPRLRCLISRLDELESSDPGYDDAVAEIGECVLPSMDGAQTVLLAMVRMAGMDTAALGDQMTRGRRTQQQKTCTRIGLRPPLSTAALGGWPPAFRLASLQVG